MFKGLSLKKKLFITILSAGTIPVLTIALITLWNNYNTFSETTLNSQVSIRDLKEKELSNLFENMSLQIKTMSSESTVIDAMKNFTAAFDSYESTKDPDAVYASLKEFYSKEFKEKYKNENGGKDASDLIENLNRLSPKVQAFQYEYISNNTNSLGNKHELFDSLDGSLWSMHHAKNHARFKNFLEAFGYYDIFLVEPHTGHIVYSVFKELDFATSLLSGPYAQTNFADAFRLALKSTDANDVHIVDLAPYYPSYEYPAGFLSSPIVDEGNIIGVLIFQIPVEKIDAILTSSHEWKKHGLGESGETYILGSDNIMRSTSRFLYQDKDNYIETMRQTDLEPKYLEYMQQKNTTTLAQKYSNDVFSNLGPNGWRGETIDYRGEEVFAAAKKVEISGLNWRVISSTEKSEALAPLYNLFATIVIVFFVLVIAIVMATIKLSSSITDPVVGVLKVIGGLSSDNLDISSNIDKSSRKVAKTTSQQASAIQQSVASMAEMTSMVGQTIDQVSHSRNTSHQVKGKSKDGKEIMDQMMTFMTNLSNAMEEIQKSTENLENETNKQMRNVSEIIEEISQKTIVINDIVKDTKLLSFNASIEAARAGQHGKGFAVVAQEVGNLATMSGKAAEAIGGLIGDSKEKVESIVQSTQQSVKTTLERVDEGHKVSNKVHEVSGKANLIFSEIASDIQDITTKIEAVKVAADEQKKGLDQMNIAMKSMDKATQNTNIEASNNAKLADQIKAQSHKLMSIKDKMDLIVQGHQSAQKNHSIASEKDLQTPTPIKQNIQVVEEEEPQEMVANFIKSVEQERENINLNADSADFSEDDDAGKKAM